MAGEDWVKVSKHDGSDGWISLRQGLGSDLEEGVTGWLVLPIERGKEGG